MTLRKTQLSIIIGAFGHPFESHMFTFYLPGGFLYIIFISSYTCSGCKLHLQNRHFVLCHCKCVSYP